MSISGEEKLRGKIEKYVKWENYVHRGDTALLVIDMQNDVIKKEGNLSAWGIWKHAQETGVVNNIKSVVLACRAAGIPIFWIRQYRLAGGQDLFPGTFDGARLASCRENFPEFQLQGSWEVEIVDELKEVMDDKDIPVEKAGSSSFEGTNLQRYLVQLGVKNILLCGCITSVCVEATGRSGRDRGYMPIMIGDACAARSEEEQKSTLERFAWILGHVVTSAQLIKLLKRL